MGLGLIIAEDSVDRDVALPLERRIGNPYLKTLLRSAVNPGRSLANILGGNVPWHRYTRMGDQGWFGRKRSSQVVNETCSFVNETCS